MDEQQQLEMAQQASEGSAAAGVIGVVFMLAYLGILFVGLAGAWKTFEKAGRPGWAVIVPFYNMIVGAQIAGHSGWFAVLMLIPGVNLVVSIFWGQSFAKAFGKGVGFGLGLSFLYPIFFAILGFGNAEYGAGAMTVAGPDQARRAA
jgi:uncharacterized membrane protein YhaH (DUF805 family)